jgi:DNA (cytosine-5)-methyltransferase 1
MKVGSSFHNTRLLRKSSPVSHAFTLTASACTKGGRCEHHWENRKFTISELIRIMSFPDDYYLGKTYKEKVERLGRSVPPLMMKSIGEYIYNTILK